MTEAEETIGNNAKSALQSYVERVESVEAQIKEFAADRTDIYAEAKSNGFDVPALKAIVRMRREDAEKRRAREAQIDLYRSTLGGLD